MVRRMVGRYGGGGGFFGLSFRATVLGCERSALIWRGQYAIVPTRRWMMSNGDTSKEWQYKTSSEICG